MAGKALKSTVPRTAEIDCSSGGRVSGVATRAVSSSAIAPTPHRAHFTTLSEPRIKDFSMVIPASFQI